MGSDILESQNKEMLRDKVNHLSVSSKRICFDPVAVGLNLKVVIN